LEQPLDLIQSPGGKSLELKETELVTSPNILVSAMDDVTKLTMNVRTV
jgi:hypothetical protein